MTYIYPVSMLHIGQISSNALKKFWAVNGYNYWELKYLYRFVGLMLHARKSVVSEKAYSQIYVCWKSVDEKRNSKGSMTESWGTTEFTVQVLTCHFRDFIPWERPSKNLVLTAGQLIDSHSILSNITQRKGSKSETIANCQYQLYQIKIQLFLMWGEILNNNFPVQTLYPQFLRHSFS